MDLYCENNNHVILPIINTLRVDEVIQYIGAFLLKKNLNSSYLNLLFNNFVTETTQLLINYDKNYILYDENKLVHFLENVNYI